MSVNRKPSSSDSALSLAAIESAAAEWLARQDAGWTPAEQADFQRWLTADARHAAAWQEVEAAWRTFDAPRRSGTAARMIGELATRQRRRRRRTLVVSGTAALLAAAVAFVFVAHPFRSRPAAPIETANVRVLRPERRQLADGSVVELKVGAQIDVRFSAAQRDVRLVRGEAHFVVAKDPARPFVVATGATKVRAVGTAFAVGLRAQAVDILVTEGTVAVSRTAPAAPGPVPVPSGNALVVSNSAPPDAPLRLEPVTSAEMERRLAWRAPRLELAQTPLSDIVASFNRANRLQLTVADPKLAGLRLSGVFRADQPDDFVRLLESHYDVRVDRSTPGRVVLRRTP